ncbi:MAG: glucose-1-phosphate adenylyltransferase family protein [Dissulfurimicrobium sp.]|uniref:glucose-1-phosphate adenylyltransferase family protein n=1 Tax=Dissulfurimicrobium TaxID=1769732 RepID=UPI001EDA9AED|nr:sugar phosphate nucleotidyltransferase [Dissulfurimicrobium hydrothermale]UKL13488.1 glucose-1-phosphate adenylyltransferase [Dissulfurimicrobium hydrothermale]
MTPKVVAMVLAGGRVGELDVLTYFRPKSTLPFGGLYRIIDFPLSNLMHSGIERVGILSQYRSSSLIEHIGTGSAWDMTGRNRGINLLPPFHGLNASDWYKGTADAVYQNLDFISSHNPDLVMVLSGDHVYKMDYRAMLDFHIDMDADVTAAFVNVEKVEASRFGLACFRHDDPRGGYITEYAEKPSSPISNWASLTIYIFKIKVLERILNENAGMESHEFGKDIIPSMIGRFKVYAYKFSGFWGYSRTIKEYWNTNMALLGNTPKIDLDNWQVRTNLDHEAIRDRGPAIIGPNGLCENSRFYNGVKINGCVRNSILFPGVKIEEGAQITDSILFFDTHVDQGAVIDHAIIDINTTISRDSKIGGAEAITVIGANAQIPKGMNIKEGTRIKPGFKGNI